MTATRRADSVSGFLFGILGGGLAWVATMILGQPLNRFFALRGAAAKLLLMYEPSGNRAVIAKWLEERSNAYRVCGAELAGFAATHNLPERLLRRYGFIPLTAGLDLMRLASMSPGDADRSAVYGSVVDSLKIKRWMM